jgi:cation transport ATPase
VNFATSTATVEFDPAHAAVRNLVDAIEELGYGVLQPETAGEDTGEESRNRREREYAALKRRLWLAAAFAAPVVALGMAPGLMHLAPLRMTSWIQLALTTRRWSSMRARPSTRAPGPRYGTAPRT